MEDIAGKILSKCLGKPIKDKKSKSRDITDYKFNYGNNVVLAKRLPADTDNDEMEEQCKHCGKNVAVPWSSEMEGMKCPYCKKITRW